jgi:hypothetical protein
MNAIEQLKKEIKEIEANIPPEASKEELYDVLVQAFFKAKDIIELYDDKDIMVDNSSLAEISELEVKMAVLTTTVATLTNDLEKSGSKIYMLERKLQDINDIIN